MCENSEGLGAKSESFLYIVKSNASLCDVLPSSESANTTPEAVDTHWGLCSPSDFLLKRMQRKASIPQANHHDEIEAVGVSGSALADV